MAAEDLAMINNADVVLLGPVAIDRSRNLVVRHEPDRADPWGVVADRAKAESDLVIVREAPINVRHPLGPTIAARIGEIAFALGAVRGISPIDPGHNRIDGVINHRL